MRQRKSDTLRDGEDEHQVEEQLDELDVGLFAFEAGTSEIVLRTETAHRALLAHIPDRLSAQSFATGG